MTDPRIEDNAKEIKRLHKAIIMLATCLEGISFRIASDEETDGIDILDRIREILGEVK